MWGDDIRVARETLGLSQSELARRAKVSRKQLILIERNENASLETIAKLADHLPSLKKLTLGGHSVALLTAAPIQVTAMRRSVARIASEVETLQRLVAAQSGEDAAGLLTESASRLTSSGSSENVVPLAKRSRATTARPDPFTTHVPGAPFRPVTAEDLRELFEEEVLVEVKARAAAGTGIEFQVNGEWVSVPKHLAPDESKGEYLLKAEGESMLDFGIRDGGYMVVQRRERGRGVAAHGEVVIGWLMTPTHEGLVVKRWYRKRGKKMLVSGNESHPPIELHEDRGDSFELQGIVRRSFRRRELEVIDHSVISG